MNIRFEFKDKAAAIKTAQGSISGAALAHMGCIAAPLAATAMGVGLSATFMNAAMFIGAPVLAVGITYGLSRLHGCPITWKKLASAGAIALVISTGINQLMGGHDAHHQGTASPYDNNIMMPNGQMLFSPEDICRTDPNISLKR